MIITKNSLNKDLPVIKKASLIGRGNSSKFVIYKLSGRELRRAIAKEQKTK